MRTYGEGLVDLARDQVGRASAAYTKMGTVISRDTTGAGAQVSFYGSDGGISDVKCPESVLVAEGDLVGLVKYEHDWIITTNYAPRQLADKHLSTSWPSVQSTQSTTYVDMPLSPSIEYTKMRDATVMRFSVQLSGFVSVAAVIMRIGVHITSVDGVTDYVEDVAHMAFNTASEHGTLVGTAEAASAHPAGEYAIVVQWRRAGSVVGDLRVDSNDRMYTQVREVWP